MWPVRYVAYVKSHSHRPGPRQKNTSCKEAPGKQSPLAMQRCNQTNKRGNLAHNQRFSPFSCQQPGTSSFWTRDALLTTPLPSLCLPLSSLPSLPVWKAWCQPFPPLGKPPCPLCKWVATIPNSQPPLSHPPRLPPVSISFKKEEIVIRFHSDYQSKWAQAAAMSFELKRQWSALSNEARRPVRRAAPCAGGKGRMLDWGVVVGVCTGPD